MYIEEAAGMFGRGGVCLLSNRGSQGRRWAALAGENNFPFSALIVCYNHDPGPFKAVWSRARPYFTGFFERLVRPFAMFNLRFRSIFPNVCGGLPCWLTIYFCGEKIQGFPESSGGRKALRNHVCDK